MAMPLERGRAYGPARTKIYAPDGLFSTALEMWRAVAALLDEWRGARALGRLDDAALKDFGLGRSEIDWAVRNGRR